MASNDQNITTNEEKMSNNDDRFVDAVEKQSPIDPVDKHQGRSGSVSGKIRSSISVQHDLGDAVEGQVFSMNDVDPALDKKMRLVNQVYRDSLLCRGSMP
jgi:hypothetical protein